MVETTSTATADKLTPDTVPPAESQRRVLVHELVDDVRGLVRYAVQTGQLPDAVNITAVYDACIAREQEQEITPEQFGELVKYYQILERHFPTVSAQSLAATAPKDPDKLRTSAAGRYLFKLWIWTAVVVIAILSANVLQYLHGASLPPSGESPTASYRVIDLVFEALRHLEPFLYGALGAFVYVLRVTEERLHTREFDPARAKRGYNHRIMHRPATGERLTGIVSDSGCWKTTGTSPAKAAR